MPDIIQLLPDSVANQIAAGEVIQRPASAVKELLENAVDAKSKRIEAFIKDSGKTLIQIIDDGSGMSSTDARMAFERHATSKIRSADDLFSILTMGFRGEALASIAAISQVEIKSRRQEDELGTYIEIEGNEIKKQEPAGVPAGTSISIKNLFYNVPARRNFLKTNTIEAKHIIDEFERVAYANPEISFALNQNGIDIFRLSASNFRQRIVSINGNTYNERLVPVEEVTSLLSINGFIGKPEFSKKTRGEQFFFVNKRFIKDGYLHHAVTKAFEELLPHDSFASYWLCITIDPSRIDVNIHPTKTEIKFDDERAIYAIVRAAVKRSLGMYSVTPTLNFEHEKSFDVPYNMRYQAVPKPALTINTGFNPFDSDNKKIAAAGWQSQRDVSSVITEKNAALAITETLFTPDEKEFQVFQMGNFLLCPQEDGLLVIDVAAAREKILYQRFINQLSSSEVITQQSLFPQTITFSSGDYELVKEITPEIRNLGFDIQEFGPNSYVIQGIPPDVEAVKVKDILESMIEQFKHNSSILSTGIPDKISRSLARSISIRKSTLLSPPEMKLMVHEIRKMENHQRNYGGKPFVILLKTADIEGRFR